MTLSNLTLRWPRGRKGGCHSQQAFPVFLGNGKSFYFKQNFQLWSHPGVICPLKKFSDRTYRLGSKIRQREGAGGGNHPTWTFLTYFSNHEDDIQS